MLQQAAARGWGHQPTPPATGPVASSQHGSTAAQHTSRITKHCSTTYISCARHFRNLTVAGAGRHNHSLQAQLLRTTPCTDANRSTHVWPIDVAWIKQQKCYTHTHTCSSRPLYSQPAGVPTPNSPRPSAAAGALKPPAAMAFSCRLFWMSSSPPVPQTHETA